MKNKVVLFYPPYEGPPLGPPLCMLSLASPLLEAGFRVPQDFSIVGFDDIEISRFLVPPLTTVGQPTSEMGAKAVDLLLQLMSHQAEDGNKVATNFLVAPTLFIRGSTATPSTNK